MYFDRRRESAETPTVSLPLPRGREERAAHPGQHVELGVGRILLLPPERGRIVVGVAGRALRASA
jgi:hypothetical protein